MKALQYFLIAFVALFQLSSTNLSSIVYFSFKINQLAIIQNYCVNQEKPKLKCNGKCYLSDQLEKAEKPGNSDPLANLEEFKVHLYLNSIQYEFPHIFNFETDQQLIRRNIKLQEFTFDIFHPPKLSRWHIG